MIGSVADEIAPGRLAGAAARIVDRRLRRVAATVEVLGDDVTRCGLESVPAEWASARVILYYWIADAMPLMLYAHCVESVREEMLRFVCDDTFGGRVTAGVLARQGRSHWPLRSGSEAIRVKDVKRLIGGAGAFGFAVDGRGPYGVVRPESARLVERCDGVAVPVALRLDRSLALPMRATIRVPRHGTRLAAAVGTPVRAGRDVARLQERMQEALEAAGARADRLLVGGNDAVDQGRREA